jgi:hypothetical protein
MTINKYKQFSYQADSNNLLGVDNYFENELLGGYITSENPSRIKTDNYPDGFDFAGDELSIYFDFYLIAGTVTSNLYLINMQASLGR